MLVSMKQALFAIALLGCESAPSPEAKPAVAPKPELDARFAEAMRTAAAAYTKWGRVDEQVRMGPEDCRAPIGDANGTPSRVRLSQAPEGPHGAKLYYLWASDRGAYRADGPIAKGFTIVKEAFQAVPAATAANAAPSAPEIHRAPDPIRVLEADGKRLQTGPAAGLFIMTKLDGPDTDAGWIYGTVVDGVVTSAGRVASCMGCHEDATRERLFGLK
jgi:hypothetical protein